VSNFIREPAIPYPSFTLTMWEENQNDVLRLLAEHVAAVKARRDRNNEKRKVLIEALTQDGTAAQKRKAKSALDEVLPVESFFEGDVYRQAFVRLSKSDWNGASRVNSAASLCQAMNDLKEATQRAAVAAQEVTERLKRARAVLAEEVAAGRMPAEEALSLSDADAKLIAEGILVQRAINEESGPVDCPCDNCGEWFPEEKRCQCGNRRICWESSGDFLLGKGYVYAQAY
jgi:hypothetical protein